MAVYDGHAAPEREETEQQLLYAGKWVDVQDTDQRWYEAQVVEVKDIQVRLAVRGYDETGNLWLRADSPRIGTLFSHEPRGRGQALDRIVAGDFVDARDSTGQWHVGTVQDSDGAFLLVHFPRIHKKEWLGLGSGRLAPVGTRSSRADERDLGELSGTKTRKHVEASERDEDAFRAQLHQRGLCIDVMDGDGNCLFRAVSRLLYGTQEHHRMVRLKCMEYMGAQRDFFSRFVAGSFDRYVAFKRQDGVWGDHIEIQAMSEVYNRQIHVHAYSIEPISVYRMNMQSQLGSPLRLSYHFQSHYNAIIEIGTTRGLLTSAPGVAEDAATASSLQNTVDLDVVHALESSRAEFESLDKDELELAAQESLNQLEEANQHRLEEAVHRSVDDAVSRVLQETEATATEEQVVQSVLQESAMGQGSGNAAVDALIQLGFSQEQSEEAIVLVHSMYGDDLSTDTLVAYALNYLAME